MARKVFPLSFLILFGFTSTLLITHSTSQNDRQTYIVYMGDRPKGNVSVSTLHLNMIKEVVGSDVAPKVLLHSYKRSFSGFVVMLTKEEMQKMAEMEGVISVFPNVKHQLHTTRSWDFLGIHQQVKRTTRESDIIIGVIDSGIWPESDSFNDKGFGPPPKKWRGTCQGHNFTCNNKIIGARYCRASGSFKENDIISPRDSNGHGTHTASIAAGGLVSSASLFGLGAGTARGGVPLARIAVYKPCWEGLISCDGADILAAFDDAIADGVDIISISAGQPAPDYFQDPIAIGAFHALRYGILTSTSAGNEGPALESLANFAPWLLSAAASTTDRKFFTKIQLGNRIIYEGVSINTFDLNGSFYPIIYGGDAPNVNGGFNGSSSRYCTNGTLDDNLIKGKIVLCESLEVTQLTSTSGATGLVIQNNSYLDSGFAYVLPASQIPTKDGESVQSYIRRTRFPSATIFKSNSVQHKQYSLHVPYFSSRGPNPVTRDILKPDISGPGVQILASWSPTGSPSGYDDDNRQVQYNIMSGTSMACPHVTAAAAYIKSFYPTWSPAAVRSALMTTAVPMSAELNPDAELAYGAGNIDPIKALYPGLIYDAGEIDYIKFLCGQGYNRTTLNLISNEYINCSDVGNETVWDLNYPSFAASVSTVNTVISRVFTRTVTNVGLPNSSYKATVTAVEGIEINVIPDVLSFTSLGQKLSFQVRILGKLTESMQTPSLVWDDGNFQVRSPIVVFHCK